MYYSLLRSRLMRKTAEDRLTRRYVREILTGRPSKTDAQEYIASTLSNLGLGALSGAALGAVAGKDNRLGAALAGMSAGAGISALSMFAGNALGEAHSRIAEPDLLSVRARLRPSRRRRLLRYLVPGLSGYDTTRSLSDVAQLRARYKTREAFESALLKEDILRH